MPENKSLEACFPHIAKEWDESKNNSLTPKNVTSQSGRKVWWICKEGHSYQARIADRTEGHGCPYCSGRKAISGINDLATLHPQLVITWDHEKNTVPPSEYRPGSHSKVWWKCENGHSWQATIKNRVNDSGCPYCSGTKVISGQNDLQSKYPILVQEWHPQKNEGVFPENVACYSNQKVWWLGRCGHEWQDTPSHRVSGRGCPVCNKHNKTSFPEQAIYYYILKQYPDAINGYSHVFSNAMEIDIYIPSLRIGLEYDGKAWHKTKQAFDREIRKYKICQDNGIRLVRVKEEKRDSDYTTCDEVIYCSQTLDETIKNVLSLLSISQDVNTEADRIAIQEYYLSALKTNSFEQHFPSESKQWHPIKNGTLLPSMFTSGSGQNVWWCCEKGHEWQMPINERSQGNGCPYCSNHRVWPGFNDLASQNPKLAKQWHPAKNLPETPESILVTSTYNAWWVCEKGHEWQNSVRERTRGRGCPVCANKKVQIGVNDLATTHPHVAAQWDFDRNRGILPSSVTRGSSKKVWWICEQCVHHWRSSISARTSGSGCPACSYAWRTRTYRNSLKRKHGALSETHPHLVAELNEVKNCGISIDSTYMGSQQEVWWTCKTCGYEWKARIDSRAKGNTGCPQCLKKVRAEEVVARSIAMNGSFLSRFPDIACQWDYQKNEKGPDSYAAFSGEKVWWKCEKGHEWQAIISSRSNGGGCPYCSSRRILEGFNDLGTINPKLAKEWHPSLNGSISPKNVMPGSGKKAWWKCPLCGHEWKAVISNRNKGSGCPNCALDKLRKKKARTADYGQDLRKKEF